MARPQKANLRAWNCQMFAWKICYSVIKLVADQFSVHWLIDLLTTHCSSTLNTYAHNTDDITKRRDWNLYTKVSTCTKKSWFASAFQPYDHSKKTFSDQLKVY